MVRPLKRGIAGAGTIIISKDFQKNAFIGFQEIDKVSKNLTLHCDFIMNLLTNSHIILQIYHSKVFKMRYTR